MSRTAHTAAMASLIILSSIISPAAALKNWQKTTDGIILQTNSGATRVHILTDKTIRIEHSPSDQFPETKSLAVNAQWHPATWKTQETTNNLVLVTSKLRVVVDKSKGSVEFQDSSGKAISSEFPFGTAFTPTDKPGSKTYISSQKFIAMPGEAYYGLGCLQLDKLDYRGKKFRLYQQNTVDVTPVLLSSRGYGILWDNPAVGSIDIDSKKGDIPLQLAGAGIVEWSSESAKSIDYYFMYGPEFDDIIASYRQATGKAPMFGKWAYGLWQCKEHYHTQQEILDVAEGYRSRKIPLDNIVQDWYYWVPKPWGTHEFDPERYPDMAWAIDKLHKQYNLHVMISVWPKFDPGSKNYDELTSIGGLFPATRPCAAYYDAFSEKAREVYWRQMKDQLFSKGIDAWWLDATEPEYTWPIRPDLARDFKTGLGPGVEVWNAYPLMTTTAVYEGQRKATSDKRVYILTRSCYAGIQRNASCVWSGDIEGKWDVFRTQISSGLNFCMAGIPYWATDIGGFDSPNADDPAFRELFVRWFQWGSFCPIFRVHGTNGSREMWRFGPEAEKIQIKFDNLRYRLLPYIYSNAWQVTDKGYTIMRALIMDFRSDSQARDIADQFMFGPALLINPVYKPGAVSREVYLPGKSGWYDFWTGEILKGGQTITADAPLETMPIYVRAGSIIPMGPFIQYSNEKPADPIELRIYPGADGKFTLYEDEGDNYNYEKGKYATIPITWDNKAKKLTIGERKGSFEGMLKNRTFKFVIVHSGHGTGLPETAEADKVIGYKGAAVSIKL